LSNCLVTGGAGFIGSNLCKELLARGHRVKVIDNLSTGKIKNISPFIDKIEFIKGDLKLKEDAKKACEGIDYIFHEAAIPSVRRSVEDPVVTNDANISGTLNLLIAAKEAKVKRVVYAGSSSIYGDSPVLPKKEDMKPDPLSPYAVSKLTGEYYCKVFSSLYGIDTVTLRYFNVFGPNQDPSSLYSGVISIFITKLLEGKNPTIFGDGRQSRDFTFVKNVVEGNILAATVPLAANKIINIACGNRIDLNQLVNSLNEILNSKIKPIYTDSRPGDVKHSQADISLAREILGYSPRFSFKDGLIETVRWYNEEHEKE